MERGVFNLEIELKIQKVGILSNLAKIVTSRVCKVISVEDEVLQCTRNL